MDLINLEDSFRELNKLNIAKFTTLPINAKIEDYKNKIEKLKFPVWIKIDSGEHKLKQGGVKKCHSFKELKETHQKFKEKFPGKKFIIQKNVKGEEIIIGVKQDKTFGKVLLLGSGGKFSEIIKDIEFRTLPIKKSEILKAIKELKIYKSIKNLKIKKLIKLIKKFSDLVIKKDIKEADLNPVIINNKDVVVVDARVSI
jgi:succinyl-CoA synthetase beta subunit